MVASANFLITLPPAAPEIIQEILSIFIEMDRLLTFGSEQDCIFRHISFNWKSRPLFAGFSIVFNII